MGQKVVGDVMAKYEVDFLDQVRSVMANGSATDRYIEVGFAGVPYLTDEGAENMRISHEHAEDTTPSEVVDFHLMEGMVEVLENRGEFFHGGREREVAQEWLDDHFFPDQAADWMDAGVWRSSVARTIETGGQSASDLKKIDPELIYAWCNGDKVVVWPSA